MKKLLSFFRVQVHLSRLVCTNLKTKRKEKKNDNNNNNNEEILFEDNKPIQRTKSYSKRTKNVPKDVIYIYIYLLMRKYLNFCWFWFLNREKYFFYLFQNRKLSGVTAKRVVSYSSLDLLLATIGEKVNFRSDILFLNFDKK